MPEYLHPGVYVEELTTGNKPIEGVSTSTVGFLGIAERGPSGPGSATLITSYTDYARAFGGPVLKQPVWVANGGSGYTNGSGNGTFPATIVGGTSTQPATVTVTLTGGAVTAVTLVNAGTYTAAPTSPAGISGLTGGSGATIGFNVAGQLTGPLQVANGGSGYTNGSGNGTFPATLVGGQSTQPATVTVTLTGGAVTAVTLANAGTYTAAPTSPAGISGLTGGSGATISFNVAGQLTGPLQVANGGNGYTNGSGNGTFPATLVGGTSTQATTAATVNVTLTGGVVTDVTLVSVGSYTAPPPIPAQITGLTGGSGALIGFNPTNGQTYLAYAVEGFFQNGGKRCYVQTVTSSASTEASLSVTTGTMNINAVSNGSWGDRVAVKIEPGSTSGTKLTVMYWSTPPKPDPTNNKVIDPTSRDPKDLRSAYRLEPQVIEVYDSLDSSNPLSPNSYGNRINAISNLITVTQPTGTPSLALTLLTGGTDGWLAPADFRGNPTDLPGQKQGLDAFTEIDEISLLCCPDSYALTAIVADDTVINDYLVDQCEVLKSRFAIISSKSDDHPLAPTFNIPISPPSKYAAFYYPWCNITDPQTGLTGLIPPGGHIAGIYALTDDARGVQKAPANVAIQGIDSLQVKLTDAQQDILNPQGINLLRYFKGYGNVVWGARTTSLDPDWKYINVRRIFIFVEQSILRATQWAVFEINDEPTWAQVRRSIGDFLTRLWMDDVLQGATKEEAFFVRCDRTTMTQYDIDNGRLICIIGIAPVKPAEFVIFRIGQWAEGSSVSEQ